VLRSKETHAHVCVPKCKTTVVHRRGVKTLDAGEYLTVFSSLRIILTRFIFKGILSSDVHTLLTINVYDHLFS